MLQKYVVTKRSANDSSPAGTNGQEDNQTTATTTKRKGNDSSPAGTDDTEDNQNTATTEIECSDGSPKKRQRKQGDLNSFQVQEIFSTQRSRPMSAAHAMMIGDSSSKKSPKQMSTDPRRYKTSW